MTVLALDHSYCSHAFGCGHADIDFWTIPDSVFKEIRGRRLFFKDTGFWTELLQPMATTDNKVSGGGGGSSSSAALLWARICKECGQPHDSQDSHLYEYQDEVDDELVCHICLQPLLRPMDTPCGHTYCFLCLSNFLKEQDFCPVDRQRLQLHQCRPSSLLVRNLLDKLTVLCPHYEECQQQMQRCELQPHLHNR